MLLFVARVHLGQLVILEQDDFLSEALLAQLVDTHLHELILREGQQRNDHGIRLKINGFVTNQIDFVFLSCAVKLWLEELLGHETHALEEVKVLLGSLLGIVDVLVLPTQLVVNCTANDDAVDGIVDSSPVDAGHVVHINR